MKQTVHKIASLFNLFVEDDECRRILLESDIITRDLAEYNIKDYIDGSIDDIMTAYPLGIDEDTFIDELDLCIENFVDAYNEDSMASDDMNTFLLYRSIFYLEVDDGRCHYDFPDDVDKETRTAIRDIVNQAIIEYREAGSLEFLKLYIIIIQIGIIVKDIPMITLRIDNPYKK